MNAHDSSHLGGHDKNPYYNAFAASLDPIKK